MRPVPPTTPTTLGRCSPCDSRSCSTSSPFQVGSIRCGHGRRPPPWWTCCYPSSGRLPRSRPSLSSWSTSSPPCRSRPRPSFPRSCRPRRTSSTCCCRCRDEPIAAAIAPRTPPGGPATSFARPAAWAGPTTGPRGRCLSGRTTTTTASSPADGRRDRVLDYWSYRRPSSSPRRRRRSRSRARPYPSSCSAGGPYRKTTRTVL